MMLMNTLLVRVNAHLLPKHCINDTDYTVQHDIFPLSSIELLVVPEDRRYWTL